MSATNVKSAAADERSDAQADAARETARTAASGRDRFRAYFDLTKPGITRMSVLTALAGYYMALTGPVDWVVLVHLVVGTTLAASGTNALNQVAEHEIDGRMLRTRTRPLPSGRLGLREAAAFSWGTAIVGLLYLALFVDPLTSLVVAGSTASYVFLYTPLKRRSSLATIVGALPGALPILAGWTAAGNGVNAVGWSLFWILFLWQLPHFLALAWIFRDDYKRGGLAMLSVFDPGGEQTSRQALLYSLTLLPVSLLPTLLGLTGAVYFFGALVLGIAFAALGVAMVVERTNARARRLFLGSNLYLLLLMILMVVDKVPA